MRNDVFILVNETKKLTFSGHAHSKAFLQATVLTTVTTERGNLTLLIVRASVIHTLSYTAPEKTLQHKTPQRLIISPPLDMKGCI